MEKNKKWKCVKQMCGGSIGEIYSYLKTINEDFFPIYSIYISESGKTTTDTMIYESNSGKNPGYIEVL